MSAASVRRSSESAGVCTSTQRDFTLSCANGQLDGPTAPAWRWMVAFRVPMGTAKRGRTIVVVSDILERFEGVRERGPGQWAARCPAHEDRLPSLSVRELDDGTVLLHCFAGCSALDVCRAIGVGFRDLFAKQRVRLADDGERHRFSAAERLELLEHEIGVAFFIAHDFLRDKTIAQGSVQRLAQCLERIARARHA